MSLQVTPNPVQVFASASQRRYVFAFGDTVYYGSTSAVSPTSNSGSLTNGQQLSMTQPLWFVTSSDVGRKIPGSARLEVVERDELSEDIANITATGADGTLPGRVSTLETDLGTLQGTVSGNGTTLTSHDSRITAVEGRKRTQSIPFAQATGAIGASGTFRVPAAGTLTRVNLSCTSAPVGSSLTVVLRKNGATVQSLTIAAGSTTEQSATLATAVVAGDKLDVNATSVGSTTPANNVVLQVEYEV